DQVRRLRMIRRLHTTTKIDYHARESIAVRKLDERRWLVGQAPRAVTEPEKGICRIEQCCTAELRDAVGSIPVRERVTFNALPACQSRRIAGRSLRSEHRYSGKQSGGDRNAHHCYTIPTRSE